MTHFGIFVEEMRQGLAQPGAFREAFELAERADAWGLDCVWLGEIHFTPSRSIISASLQVAASIATRTLQPRAAVALSAVLNMARAFISLKVAAPRWSQAGAPQTAGRRSPRASSTRR